MSVSTSTGSIEVDKANKTITIPATSDTLYGKVEVQGITYTLKLDAWDWHTEKLFPACRVEGPTIIINRTYPLFQQRKYTDIFVKLHMLLIEAHGLGKLPQISYENIINKILIYFNDYIKGE